MPSTVVMIQPIGWRPGKMKRATMPTTKPMIATDLEAVADGYVAVTPLHLDLTHEPSVAPLAAMFAGG